MYVTNISAAGTTSTDLVDTLIYAFFYTYTFELINQTAQPAHHLEDKINKPDRPLVTDSITLRSARIRFYISLAVWLADIFGSWKYTANLSNFGPTKDLSITVGAVAQLIAAWHIGGSDPIVGWHWVKVLAAWMYPTIGIQDIRDVPGDLAVGRRTTVILLGDITGMILFLSSNFKRDVLSLQILVKHEFTILWAL